MRAVLLITVLMLALPLARASTKTAAPTSNKISLTVDSLSNLADNSALEACGTAIHKDGVKPLLVTIKHSDSYYTVLTAPNGVWCVVIKRWTFDGKIDVSATTLQEQSMKFYPVDISRLRIK